MAVNGEDLVRMFGALFAADPEMQRVAQNMTRDHIKRQADTQAAQRAYRPENARFYTYCEERSIVGYGRHQEPIYAIECTVVATEIETLTPPRKKS